MPCTNPSSGLNTASCLARTSCSGPWIWILKMGLAPPQQPLQGIAPPLALGPSWQSPYLPQESLPLCRFVASPLWSEALVLVLSSSVWPELPHYDYDRGSCVQLHWDFHLFLFHIDVDRCNTGLWQLEDGVWIVFIRVVRSHLVSMQLLGFLLPFVLLVLCLALVMTCLLDVANLPAVATFGCPKFAVFCEVTGAVTVVAGRRCSSTNDHDTGTWKLGALLLISMQFLTFWNVNAGFARKRFCRRLSRTHTRQSCSMSFSDTVKLQCSVNWRNLATNLVSVFPLTVPSCWSWSTEL